ncbi:hypothetical protein KM176_22915 [Pseudooceanicola sp. CBS1P-1]|uniref:Capsular polysaccharide biosynthesis protein n=1 Tax=Pseudooceanicola albus TaxID=2692189 RepID=A0A6L7GC20_9RHOB|nr:MULTISPECIES: capsular polysaccharide biosynthesis protein [Pseudooceanicola]MBT9386717.1 hypothetical protein [Pseudooceanicola endophyticus]MXN20800.1 capsular polysaccharide biosynthesis protein [Pseudooceanicola albus]
MSKLEKLLRHPVQFFLDARENMQVQKETRQVIHNGKPTAILVGFSDWKTFMVDFLPGYNVVFLGHSPRVSTKKIRSITRYPDPHVFTWSYKFPPYLAQFCAEQTIPLTYVEDAFIRSFGLGAARSQPLSLLFDDRAMHFDRSKTSELDEILASHDFAGDGTLMEQAAQIRDMIVTSGLSKYNFDDTAASLDSVFPRDGRHTILVLGQVEDDLSMRYGATQLLSGNDLVTRAVLENPEARVLYRPHPEALAFSKKHYSKPEAVSAYCHVVGPEFSLRDCIAAADEVHTVTSLAGFEAALHGRKVVTYGWPFYAGWGFTEDRDPVGPRPRALRVEEVLAGAYILYPRYFHPVTRAQIPAMEAIHAMQLLKGASEHIARDRAAVS